ncbi:MAG: transglutaminase-like domain-containing protein [Cyclobacteriaceae bacterium]
MTDSEIKALISLLDDTDHEVRKHVEEKISSLGDDVIPYLEDAWESSFNPNQQKQIEDLLHQLQFDKLKQKLVDWSNSEEQDLLEGISLVATYQYPDLDIAETKKTVEQMYYDVWLGMKNDGTPLENIKLLNEGMFYNLKFSANTKNFHAPANSMINCVLETKRGNPISLCVIYLLIAQKLKLPVYGVNLPNLFVLTYKDEETQFYINVFNKGLIFSKADIDTYIEQLKLEPQEIFYSPCTNLDIVVRALRNLTVSFEKLGAPEKVEEVRELMSVLI